MPDPPADFSPVDLMESLTEGREVPLAELWRSRVNQHELESYAGVPLSKFPEDLWTYERILWERAPHMVVEVGIQHGGSTLWLRDRLFDFQRYRCGPAPSVLAVDIDLSLARSSFDGLPAEATAGIELLEGDIKDTSTVTAITQAVPKGAEVLVIEDASHDGPTTSAALQGLAPLIQGGGYYVVEDTCVDSESLRAHFDAWPRGAAIALEDWLSNDPLGRRFRRRPDLQPYGLTCNPGGLIQRLPDL